MKDNIQSKKEAKHCSAMTLTFSNGVCGKP